MCVKRRLFWAFFLFLAFGGSLAAQEGGAWYLGKPIRTIDFNGLRSVRLADIEGVIAPYIGRIYTYDIFDELQGRLYALEYFESIRPAAEPTGIPLGSEVAIRFTVTERPHVTRIVFEGNSGLTRSTLMGTITTKVSDVANEPRIRLDEQAIISKYLEGGYPDVTVSSSMRPAEKGDGVILVFTVSEGVHTVIESVRFEGISAFSERTLLGRLSLKRRGMFSEAKLLADRVAITSYYQDRGYIDAVVQDVARTSRQDQKGNTLLTITFRVDEGRPWTFGGIAFAGNVIFSDEELSKLVTTKVGSIVNARRLEADLQRIIDLYLENGYIFNSFGREEIRREEEGVIAYEIPIVERGRAHVEHIIVQGNAKTKDHVILREIPFEPGEPFSRTKIIEGMRNLYNLQFFSNIIPDTPPGSADQLMDVIINVEEQLTTDVNFGMTFSGSSDPNDFPVSIVFSLTNRNFMGLGNSLGGDATISPTTQSASIRYTQSWLFGLPLSGGFDFTFTHRQNSAYLDNMAPWFNGDESYAYPDGFDSLEDYENSYLPSSDYLMQYEITTFSLGFSTGYRWTTPWGGVGLSGGVRTGAILNTFDATLNRPFDPQLREKNDVWIPANSLWAALTLDQRDIRYDPSRGYYLYQRAGVYGLIPGEIENEYYIKTDSRAEIFFTLWNVNIDDKSYFRGVLGLHSGLSLILPQFGSDAAVLADSSKLAIDGWFIGRGWVSERRHTGLALWDNWAELRIPLVPGILAWDFFFDAVAVASEPDYIFSNDPIGADHDLQSRMRYSIGGGLRFTIPQLPFRFLFTKRFKVVDGDVEWQNGGLFGNLGMDFVLSFAVQY
ncbi:MAG: outer membrane protein assembly factor BamA [Spirochaetaceae bacterium]|jgi:outer membrane protein insertion porin family|nr:outer membrane protein assembly factor BamA [Spirochaetaceae bacterium]